MKPNPPPTPAIAAADALVATPRTDAVAKKAWRDAATQAWQVPADFARQLERELNAAKQPTTPGNAGELREKVMSVLTEPATGSRTVRELADRILALLPAPTPATSEDTLMLDWLEKHANFIEVGHGDISPDRQALRAAMAHAGEQKT